MHIPVLVFSEAGWCEAMGKSYFPGPYQPFSEEEYRALAPFAVDALPMGEPEKEAKDEPITEPKKRGRRPK